MKVMPFLILLFAYFLKGNAQVFDSLSIRQKIDFIGLLQSEKQIDDAIFLSHHFNSTIRNDSLRLLEIKLNLIDRRFLDAEQLIKPYFKQEGNKPLSECSITLIENHCKIQKGVFTELIDPSCSNHKEHRECWKIQLLISFLLQRKTEEFDMLFETDKCKNAILSLIEFDLFVQMMEIKKTKLKKPFVAGLLSAIIPGLGKVYTKKPHEALTSFIPVAFNWLQAAEGHYLNQWKSPQFYIFGSIGTVFYFSGIAGSAASAKRKNEEFNSTINNTIDFETNKLISFY